MEALPFAAMAARRSLASALADCAVAVAASAVLLWLSDRLVPPAAEPFGAGRGGHGQYFAEMAQAPFAFTGMFPHRILWPALAHAAGWLGIGPIGFSQACNAALLAVVFWFCRQRSASWLAAGLVAAAVAVSGAVNVYKPMTCLSDSLVLSLLVLAVHFAPRQYAFWGIVLLASLAHEMVFFFAPWLVWLRCREGNGSLRRDGIALVIAVAAYGAWRALVVALTPPPEAGAPVATYDAAYYIAKNFWVPWGLPAMWALWALVVLVEFGPLLAVVLRGWRRRELGMGGRLGPWLYVASILSLMLLAYDVMRFATFVFLPVVLGGVQLARTRRGLYALAALVVAAWCTYAWHHPIPSEQGGRQFTDVAGDVQALLPAYAGPNGVRHFTFADGWSFSTELLARTWPIWLAVALGFVVVAMVAVLLDRYVGGDSEAGGEPRTMQNASP